jgi:hypothetical protein
MLAGLFLLLSEASNGATLFDIAFLITAIISFGVILIFLKDFLRYGYYFYMLSKNKLNTEKDKIPSDIIYSRGMVKIITKDHSFIKEKKEIWGPTSFNYYGVPLKYIL